MKSYSATEAKQRLAALLDEAQREPVAIRRHNRQVAVLLSSHEYARLLALNVEELQKVSAQLAAELGQGGLTAGKLAAVDPE